MSDTNTAQDLRALNHLLTLARRGKPGGGGSSGEKQARRIVLCVMENAIGLDGKASAGIADLIAYVQASPQDGRDAIRAAIK